MEAPGKLFLGDPYIGDLNKQQLRYNLYGTKGRICHQEGQYDNDTGILESNSIAFALYPPRKSLQALLTAQSNTSVQFSLSLFQINSSAP